MNREIIIKHFMQAVENQTNTVTHFTSTYDIIDPVTFLVELNNNQKIGIVYSSRIKNIIDEDIEEIDLNFLTKSIFTYIQDELKKENYIFYATDIKMINTKDISNLIDDYFGIGIDTSNEEIDCINLYIPKDINFIKEYPVEDENINYSNDFIESNNYILQGWEAAINYLLQRSSTIFCDLESSQGNINKANYIRYSAKLLNEELKNLKNID